MWSGRRFAWASRSRWSMSAVRAGIRVASEPTGNDWTRTAAMAASTASTPIAARPKRLNHFSMADATPVEAPPPARCPRQPQAYGSSVAVLAHDDGRHVVALERPAAERLDLPDQRRDRGGRAYDLAPAPERTQPILAELVAALVERLRDAVAVEQQRVARRERLLPDLVLGVLQDPQRQPAVSELDQRPVGPAQQRKVVPGVRVEQPAPLQVHLGVEERDKLAARGRARHVLVDGPHRFGDAVAAVAERAHGTLHVGHEERGGHALARHVRN